MQVGHFQGWLELETRKKEPGTGHWYLVINLDQTAFQDGLFPAESTWQTVVLRSKGNTDFCGIGLMSYGNKCPG